MKKPANKEAISIKTIFDKENAKLHTKEEKNNPNHVFPTNWNLIPENIKEKTIILIF